MIIDSYYELLCQEDQQRLKDFEESSDWNVAAFFKLLSYPMQTSCKNLKRFGRGRWTWKQGWDGHKFVCLDDFEVNQNCLVYSFGLANEWSFEIAMAHFGCQVYGFDPYIKRHKAKHKNLYVKALGVSSKSIGDFKTLSELLAANGHTNATINYLKADIEKEEIQSVPQWIESGSLDNVRQIGLEFHDTSRTAKVYGNISKSLLKIGFKLISFEPNFALPNPRQCVEVVFRRTGICGYE